MESLRLAVPNLKSLRRITIVPTKTGGNSVSPHLEHSKMKKTILFYIGVAILMVGCSKVENEEFIPENGKHTVTLKATVNEPETRVSVDASGTFSWQQDDWIVVLTDYNGEYNGPEWTKTYGPNEDGSADFELELSDGVTLGEYAFYPATEMCGVDSDGVIEFALSHYYEYATDATNMPMLGTISNNGASFKAVGGLLQITIDDIPEETDYLVFSVGDKRITGVFTVEADTEGEKIINADEYDEGTNTIEFFIPSMYWDDEMVFYIPLPCGTYDYLTFSFLNSSISLEDPYYSNTVQVPGGLTIGRNQIVIAPKLSVSSSGHYVNGHEFVDMGTSVKWATMNVGASRPEEYGDYIAWGEVEPYYSSQNPLIWKEGKEAGYFWGSYFDTSDGGQTFTKYVHDVKEVLDPEDDAARQNWGGPCRIPTHAEWMELIDNSRSTWTSDYEGTGLAGRIVTCLTTHNSIFLPAAGSRSFNNNEHLLELVNAYGSYWSSSLYYAANSIKSREARLVTFDARFSLEKHNYYRYAGFSIRPVSD